MNVHVPASTFQIMFCARLTGSAMTGTDEPLKAYLFIPRPYQNLPLDWSTRESNEFWHQMPEPRYERKETVVSYESLTHTQHTMNRCQLREAHSPIAWVDQIHVLKVVE